MVIELGDSSSQGSRVRVVKLTDLTEESPLRNSGQRVNEVRSVTNTQGLVATDQYFDNARTSADTSNYKVVAPGSLVYNPSRINIGSLAVSVEQGDVIVSPMYVVVSVDQELISPLYLYEWLQSAVGRTAILGGTEEGARFRFPFASFSKMELRLPSLAVQEQILEHLGTMSALISELEAELEARRQQYEFYRGHLLASTSENGTMIKVSDAVRAVSAPGKIERSQYLLTGAIPIVDQSQSFIAGYTNDLGIALKAEPFIIFGDHTRAVKYVDFEFVQGADGLKILRPDADFHPRYLYHALCNLEVPSRGYNRHWTVLRDLEIWAPPLEEQLRLAGLLDTFDALVNDITIGLPAELAARRKQYEYYRDKLLTFPEKVA